MTKAVLYGLALAVFVMLASASEALAAGFELSGRVHQVPDGRGVAGLAVKLIPPEAMKAPVVVTATDGDGAFRFRDLHPGRYVLEIRHGLDLIYRETVDVAGNVSRDIGLRPKARSGT